MKEYQRIMKRKIHAANMKMRRVKGEQGSMYRVYIGAICPEWRLSEQTRNWTTLDHNYGLAERIMAVSYEDAMSSRYDNLYADHIKGFSPGILPMSPDDWKIFKGV